MFYGPLGYLAGVMVLMPHQYYSLVLRYLKCSMKGAFVVSCASANVDMTLIHECIMVFEK